MKVVCISDTHMRHDVQIPDGDVLVHSGDFAINASINDIDDFAEWFGGLPHKHKVFVPGNHDWVFQDQEEYARGIFNKYNIITLIDQSMTIKGVKFYGTPYQPVFFDWAFNVDNDVRRKIFDKIPNDTDILVTHTPPYGILDTVARHGAGSVGCNILCDKVEEIKPKVHVFGHIHESYGEYKEAGVHYINCSLCNDRYKAVNKPVIFEIEENG